MSLHFITSMCFCGCLSQLLCLDYRQSWICSFVKSSVNPPTQTHHHRFEPLFPSPVYTPCLFLEHPSLEYQFSEGCRSSLDHGLFPAFIHGSVGTWWTECMNVRINEWESPINRFNYVQFLRHFPGRGNQHVSSLSPTKKFSVKSITWLSPGYGTAVAPTRNRCREGCEVYQVAMFLFLFLGRPKWGTEILLSSSTLQHAWLLAWYPRPLISPGGLALF